MNFDIDTASDFYFPSSLGSSLGCDFDVDASVSSGFLKQITGLWKWEQAFRVYAAIYTESNPERSGEIWQYMHGINVAASSYHWDNVASYDLTFRQLMAFKPHCSWAKTYNQGWNLAMRDPMAKNNNVAYK